MKGIYIFGASGFGREVAWLIEENRDYEILGFIDDNPNVLGTIINGYKVLGDSNYLLSKNEPVNVVVAIGRPLIRKKIVEKLSSNVNIIFPNIISKDVKKSNYITFGKGNIICAGNILTTNISMGDFNLINLSCTLGHDDILQNFITLYPGVNVSGNVSIGDCCEIGTGCKIIQGLSLVPEVIIGAGAVVVRNINEKGIYKGIPASKDNI